MANHVEANREADLSRELKRLRTQLRNWALSVICGGVVILVIGALVFQAPLGAIVSGVLASLIASVLFYLVFQQTAAGPIAALVASQASDAAVRSVLVRFASVPTRIYPESEMPTGDFERDFAVLLSDSDHYWLKGTSATFATGRLDRARTSSLFRGKQVRFLLLDPEAVDLLEAYARLELENAGTRFDQSAVAEKAKQKQHTILENLLTLSRVAEQLGVDVRLHRSFPFFRAEVFAKGLFVSFHDSGKTFPGSLFYSRFVGNSQESSTIYSAYRTDFEHSFRTSARAISSENPSGALLEIFTKLNYQEGISGLSC